MVHIAPGLLTIRMLAGGTLRELSKLGLISGMCSTLDRIPDVGVRFSPGVKSSSIPGTFTERSRASDTGSTEVGLSTFEVNSTSGSDVEVCTAHCDAFSGFFLSTDGQI